MTTLLVVLPVLIASFTLAGTFAGFYLQDRLGTKDSLLLPIALSLAGLGASLFLSYVITTKYAS